MLKGIGVDIIQISRVAEVIERYGDKFLTKIFHAEEIEYAYKKGKGFAASLAARFAAKEAVFKALGTGLGQNSWLDVEIFEGKRGQPQVKLRGKAKETAEKKGVVRIHLSLSHCREYAVAVAAIEGGENFETGNGF
ncbi:MAG TPA: holo-[acyl-carrier-protein] synthase [Peptococcaceae bacterium]|nr:MAG: Holo-[acyl-carrier-protein] synthase [Clostridia bacterium 41_269]HBT20780.1 holo-[acyl-carrier-protein] synthase [Peptococcaceae bacterium]